MKPFPLRSLLGALGAGAAILGGLYLWTSDRPVFVDSTYCMLATSLFRDADIFLLDHEPKLAETEYHLTVTGHLAMPQTGGAALVAYPFFWLGEIFQTLLWPADSERWQISDAYGPVGGYRLLWYNASAVFCGLLALLLMYRICRRLAPPAAAALAVAAVFWGTEIWMMLFLTPGGSELVALLFVALLISLCLYLDGQPAPPPAAAFLAGLLLGWLVFIRLQAAVWIALPAVYALKWRREGKVVGRAAVLLLALFGAGFALALLPQALIFREWFGSCWTDPYGGGLAAEKLASLVRLLPRHPEFISLSLVPFLGILGMILAPRPFRPLALSSALIVPAELLLIFSRRSGLEFHAYLGSRYCLILAPIFMIGLAALGAGRRTRRGRLLVVSAACLCAYAGFVGLLRRSSSGLFPPDLSAAVRALPASETPAGLLRAAVLALPLLPRVLKVMLSGPRSPHAWMAAAAVVPLVLLGVALKTLPRSPGRRLVTAGALAALLATAATLLLPARGIAGARLMTGEWERSGFYRDRWRTLRYDWSNAVDDLQLRSLSYLEAGMLQEAERLLALSMAIKPIREGAVVDLGLRLIGEYRRRAAVRHPWQAICAAYGVPGAIRAVGGVKFREEGAITDGNLLSCAPAARFLSPGPELEIALSDRSGPFSDVLVAFDRPDAVGRLEVLVSADRRLWEKPYRADPRGDTLWIWDFYQRPWRYILLSGFRRPEEASLREVFAIMSPRHGRPALGKEVKP